MLAFQESETLCWTDWPAPLSNSVSGELVALLANVMLPETLPLVVGAKVTVKGRLWPALMVTGRVIPLNENCELLELTEEIVTLEPLAVRDPL